MLRLQTKEPMLHNNLNCSFQSGGRFNQRPGPHVLLQPNIGPPPPHKRSCGNKKHCNDICKSHDSTPLSQELEGPLQPTLLQRPLLHAPLHSAFS